MPVLQVDTSDDWKNVTTGILLLGFPSRSADRIHSAAKWSLPASIDITGEETAPLDEEAIAQFLPAFLNASQIAALAVSGMNSTMNPAHERCAAEAARTFIKGPVIEARYCPGANAIERSVQALRVAAQAALLARELSGPQSENTEVAGDEALLSALAACGELKRLGMSYRPLEARLEVHITRLGREEGYACHCDQGRFQFESLLDAKAFAESHLRERLQFQFGNTDPIEIEITDRYGRGKGKKHEMRVFLESVVVARAKRGS